jgi:hypothetical protein
MLRTEAAFAYRPALVARLNDRRRTAARLTDRILVAER